MPRSAGSAEHTSWPKDAIQRVSIRGSFVQVLHTGQLHWITVSNVLCGPGEVQIFDSLPSGDIPIYVKTQIAALLHQKGEDFTITVRQCQTQRGGTDCGLFAIANAYALVQGKDPTMFQFDQNRMRQHLKICLENGKMDDFPTIGKPKKLKDEKLKKHVVPVFCTCRLPDKGEQLIVCCECEKSFHKSCVAAASPNMHHWMCEDCRERGSEGDSSTIDKLIIGLFLHEANDSGYLRGLFHKADSGVQNTISPTISNMLHMDSQLLQAGSAIDDDEDLSDEIFEQLRQLTCPITGEALKINYYKCHVLVMSLCK